MSNRPSEEQGAATARTRRILAGGLGVVAALIVAALVVTQLLISRGSGAKTSALASTTTPVSATATRAAGGQAVPVTATGRAGAPSDTAVARRTATQPAGAGRSTTVPVARSTPTGIKTAPLTAGPAIPTIGETTGATPTPVVAAATAPSPTRAGGAAPTPVAEDTRTAGPAPGSSPTIGVPTSRPTASRPATPRPASSRVAAPTPAPRATRAPAPVATSAPATSATQPPASQATQAPVPTPTRLSTVAPPVGGALAAAHRTYKVGAYYFSGWSHGQNDNISTILTGAHPGAEPLIGWYDDSQAQVDKSLDQAADAGIDFLSFDWYDTSYSPYATDRTLNEGLSYYLTSSRRRRIGFNLVFVDHAPFVPTPDHPQATAAWRATEWPRIVDQWLPLFKQPDYVRVDGKPLLIVFSPEHMREICGGSTGVRAALDYLRARARADGLPGVTVAIAATVAEHSNPIKVGALNVEGYDAATGYNYHSMGHEQYRTPVPYSNLVDENEATWNRVARSVHVPYIPVITSGWDQRYSAREQQTAIIYDGRTPGQFACYAVRARHWVDTHPAQTTGERIVMIFAWNEIGEGGAIIPNHQDGSAYADTVGRIFGTATSPPATPPDCR